MQVFQLSFGENEDFRNTLIRDSTLGNREKSAMMRAHFETLGDIVDAVTNIDDIRNLKTIDKVSGKETKIRNLGELTAKKIIPGLYREYLKNLDEVSLSKEIEKFVRMNERTVRKMPEFALVTLSPKLFLDFWSDFSPLTFGACGPK